MGNWLDDQAQRVVVNVSYSARMPVTTGTWWGCLLGPVLFNIHISDLEQVTKYTLIRFVGDTRLGGPDSALESRPATQRDLGRLDRWAYKSFTKSSKDRCKVLLMERKRSWQGKGVMLLTVLVCSLGKLPCLSWLWMVLIIRDFFVEDIFLW